ncbi:hypothetical protein H5T88_03210 [bacterium]|nr:hypothetical protein [bacterium]
MKILLLALIFVVSSFPLQEEFIRKIGDKILEYQASDGALFLYPLKRNDNIVIPYFSNYASIGLCLAYGKTKDRKYLEGAKAWLNWYASHLNPDGTIFDYKGIPSKLKPTGDYDSSDAYAGTFITAVWYFYKASQDKRYLKEIYKAVKIAVEGVKLTLQEDNLTYAKPNYPIKYLMDNVETWRGIRDAGRIAHALGYKEDGDNFTSLSSAMLKSIEENLWDKEHNCYAWELSPNGKRSSGLSGWYPEQMANLMAIALLPFSERRKELYLAMKEKLSPFNETDLEKLIWWGMAAKGAKDDGDVELFLKRIFESDFLSLIPPLLGHLLYIITD